MRYITYEIGSEVETPMGNLVTVSEFRNDVTWIADDGGRVEASQGFRFDCLKASYRSLKGDDLGSLAEAFMLQAVDGDLFNPVSERYNDDELQSRYGETVLASAATAGYIYFEIPVDTRVIAVVFDTGGEDDDDKVVPRWEAHLPTHVAPEIPQKASGSRPAARRRPATSRSPAAPKTNPSSRSEVGALPWIGVCLGTLGILLGLPVWYERPLSWLLGLAALILAVWAFRSEGRSVARWSAGVGALAVLTPALTAIGRLSEDVGT